MNLMERLEKVANEGYPEEGRINRGFAAETMLGTGPVGHLAKKHNALGVNEEDSHTVANAKLGGIGSAVPGAAYGGLLGGMLAQSKGGGAGRMAAGIGAGAAGVGALYGGVGAAAGAVNGMMHDKYDEHLRGKQASNLMDSLEKTADESYPEEGRINRGLAAETFLGSGVAGHLAKKHNVLGVRESDTHAEANAQLGALGGAIGGAGAGAMVGGAHGGGRGAAVGALGGAALYSGLGALGGAVNGYMHDKYDEHLRSKQASELIDALEKTANEAYPEEGRINRGLAAETFLGTGIAGHLAKKHNALGVNEDDSHTVANAKLGALGAGGVGLAGGALLGSEFGRRGAAIGAGIGGAAYGLTGAASGAINGKLHDMYDDRLRNKQASTLMERLEKAAAEATEEKEEGIEEEVAKAQLPENEEKDKEPKGNEVSHAEAGEEKSAADLMESLEKAAAASFGAVKKTLSDASGRQYNALNKTQKANEKTMTPKALEANARGVGFDNGGVSKARNNMEKLEGELASGKAATQAAKATRDQARGKLAPAAVGAAAVGGAAAGSAATKDKQEKTASEEFMNGLYKEAATAILSVETPEVKAYRDPMDGIKFTR